MAQRKITVVGAGNVGATTAHIAATQQLGEIVLIDIVEGLAQGKALDMAQASHIQHSEQRITGTTDWAVTEGSDIVIITSGVPRRPGMSRDDLLATNTKIVQDVSRKIVEHSPDSIIIVVCNPLDAMVYAAAQTTKFPTQRIVGMAGALDSARYCYFLATELGLSVDDIRCVLMGGHGDDMVPLPRLTSVNGIPIAHFIKQEKLEEIVQRTRKGGIEIVNLLGYSAYYAPAAGAAKMAQAILRDTHEIFSCCAYCDQQYNAGGYFVGVPAILGKTGVNSVVQLDLEPSELGQFEASLAHVKELVVKVDKLL